MPRRKKVLFRVLSALVLLVSAAVVAQELKTGGAAPPPAPAAAAPAGPQLPDYMTASNSDPKNPSWPDPNGGKVGVTVTPAPDKKGDPDPNTLTIGGLYDRLAHTAISVNMVWALVAGF